MAIIQNGVNEDDFKRQGAAGGYGVTAVTPAGFLVFKRPIFSDSWIRIPNARLTATVAANSLIWSMRYLGPNKLRVKSGMLLAGFDGVAVASTQEYNLVKFAGATPAGGTIIHPVKSDTAQPLPAVDARFNYAAALTVAGVLQDLDFNVSWGAQRRADGNQNVELNSRFTHYSAFFDLLTGEGMGIRLGVAAVVGDSLGGYFELQEVGIDD